MINELNGKHDQAVIDLQTKLDAAMLQLNSSKSDGNGGKKEEKEEDSESSVDDNVEDKIIEEESIDEDNITMVDEECSKK